MSDHHFPRWHLLGAGAIGSLFAASFDAAGTHPTLILRDGTPLLPSQWSVQEGDNRRVYTPHFTRTSANDPITHLLITTKAYQSVEALASVSHRLTRDAVVVAMHNGYGPQQQIARNWPELLVYAGTTTEGAYRVSPAALVHAGRGETWVGPVSDSAVAAGSAPLADLLKLPLGVHYDAAIDTRLWQKLAINAAINGLTVIHDCQNGELARQPELRQQMANLCEETEAIAAAINQPLFDQPLLTRALAVAEATGSNYSSMLQDVRQKRHTEMDSINGTLCRLADEHQIAAPTHHWLVEQVSQIVDQRQPTEE